MSPDSHAKLLEVLHEVLDLLKAPDCDVNWSHFDTAEEAVKEMEGHVQRIEARDFSQQRALEKLFGPGGALQEIAESNGWAKRFLTLGHTFDCCITEEE